MRFLFVIIALVVVLVGGGMGIARLARSAAQAKENHVPTTTATIRDIQQTIEVTGEVTPFLSTEVKSEVSGRLAKLYVQDGDAVTATQVVAELDRTELLGERDELLRSIESAKLRVERAKREEDRQEKLHEQGFATDQAFQDAQTDSKIADNDLQIEQARMQSLDSKLGKTTIRAPHAGTVLNCTLTEGQVVVGATSVSQGTVLMNLADLGRLLVKVNINEVDVAKMKPGMQVHIRFDSIPGANIEGQVSKVSPSALVQEKIRVFPTEITCEANDPRVKPGLSADVTVPIAQATGSVAVIVSTIFSDSSGKFVFLKSGKEFEKRRVTVGINDTQYAEIQEGLANGDEVSLTRPATFAQERIENKARDTEEHNKKESTSGRMRGPRF